MSPHARLHVRGGVCLEPILREACSQGYPVSAICVQRFDDSLSSAIRITYRISLRSSSLREPRYPSLRVVCCFVFLGLSSRERSRANDQYKGLKKGLKNIIPQHPKAPGEGGAVCKTQSTGYSSEGTK